MQPIVMRPMRCARPMFPAKCSGSSSTGSSGTRLRRGARPGWLLVVVGTLLGCGDPPAGPGPKPGTPPNLLVAADPTGDRYPNVALMVGRVDAGAPWRPACTGTLVARNIVLTAGHCVAYGELLERFKEFGVTFDPVFTSASRVVRATAHVHPNYILQFPPPLPDDTPEDLSDLALLILDEPVSLIPAHLPPPGFLDRVAGKSGPLTFVGYGIPRGDASFGERGTRRAGSVRLGPVFDPVVGTTPDPTVGCVGDSGGPLLLGPAHTGQGRGSARMVLGVAHSADCATYTTFYRVDTPQARAFLGVYLDLPGDGKQEGPLRPCDAHEG
jgi:hypothetical protein